MNEGLLRDALGYADRWLEYQQRLREIPAVTAAVRFGDALLLSKGYGRANLERNTPVTPEHIFRVASHSKWFTGTAIMLLREDGRLRLDDPLGQYIPWLRAPLAEVTIRQVLNHAAGITRDGDDNDHWQLLHPFPDAAQLRRLVEEGGAIVAPNRMLKYSNIGYSLLGIVVEAAAGVPYNEFVRARIVERLGLERTGPETNTEAQAGLVTGYTSRALLAPRMPLPDVETGAMSPATGFYSTAEDLTRFAAAHFLGNDVLLSDESKREMQRAYWPVTDMDSYGLGMQVVTIGERRMAGHSGGFPGHSTRTLLDPQDHLAISVLTSETGGVAGDLVKHVVKLIDLALGQKPVEHGADLDRYTGHFAGLWGYTDVVRLGDRLFAIPPAADDPAAVAVKLNVVDADILTIEEQDGYGSPGEQVRYTRGDDGEIERVSIAGSTQYPEGRHEVILEQRRQELSRR